VGGVVFADVLDCEIERHGGGVRVEGGLGYRGGLSSHVLRKIF
jgi:hypothetical protein